MSSKLEALLFIYGEPMTLKKIASVLGVSVDRVSQAVSDLKKALSDGSRGLMVLEHEDTVQLVTKPDFSELLGSVLKAELNDSLSSATIETLAIIAYAGPVTRAEIDYIRGVNSTFTLRALLLRGLVTRETDPGRANSFIYSVSVECLQHLGLEKLDQLPEFATFRTLAKSLKPS